MGQSIDTADSDQDLRPKLKTTSAPASKTTAVPRRTSRSWSRTGSPRNAQPPTRRSSSASPSRIVEREFRPGSKSLSQSTRNGHRRDMRYFNTTGPVVARQHYCIPPLERMDLDFVLSLIHEQECFILHAPRQTGKTSALKAIQDHLNSGAAGNYRCLYVNIEGAQTARQDVGRAVRTILGRVAIRGRQMPRYLPRTWLQP